MATMTNKLETCEVCAANKAKYTCPKCEVRTCGLTCVNIHKKELNCDGIRDKTKFIPLNSFTDLDLLSDYRLLEDIGRNVEKLQKNPVKRYSRQGQQLPLHLHKLRCAAYNKGTKLLFLPQNFSRHKKNTTYLDWNTKELYWRLEFIFLHAENTKWVIQKALETKRLSTVLEEIFYADTPSDDSNTISVLRKKIISYRGCGMTGIKALLKAEKIKKSNSRFHELDLSTSLQENFKNKTIIEYPIIYVTLKDHSDMFDIVDSDDEDIECGFKKTFNVKTVLNSKKIPVEKEPPPKKDMNSPKNYFFNVTTSDSEEEISDTTNQ